ncbi:MAG: hypothetical protein HKN41_03195 [Ilumatobacter sp.]|nr:hypothetical protein [Ilumatobacter sp.]
MILPVDPTTIADLDRLGVLIDRNGIEAVPAHLLDAVIETAEQLGIRPVAKQVLADPAEPTVARERAFAHVAYGLFGARERAAATAN